MIPIPVTVTPKNVPANFAVPNDMQGVLEAIVQYTDYEAQAAGPAVVVSKTGVETEPGTGVQVGADLNSLWVQSIGGWMRGPLALTGYRNAWHQVYTGKPGELRMFAGTPHTYFDSSGYGLPDQGWEGWALCNGNNGTVNLQYRFVIPGYRFASGQGWVTNVGTYLDQGGTRGIGGGGYGQPQFPLTWDPNYRTTSLGVDAKTWAYWFQNPWDLTTGGWSQFQIGVWNLGNSSFAPGSTPQIFAGVNVDTKIRGNFYPSDRHTATPHGGRLSLTTPGPGGNNPPVGQWMYPVDQAPAMLGKHISRLPPYIALGYVQFIGYR